MNHKLRIHILQHVPFEGPARIADWAEANEHTLTYSRFYQDDSLPEQRDFDWLVVMGGPMGVYDTETYPWLPVERDFIATTIAAGKPVLGICLGAQLIAAALNARVYPHKHREIGWFDITRDAGLKDTVLDDLWPEQINVFHWHGDTFDLPADARRIATSAACENQGFILDNRIIGLQFHIEVTTSAIAALIEHCGDELDGTRYVQSAAELQTTEHFAEIHQLLDKLLDRLACNLIAARLQEDSAKCSEV